MPVEAFDQAFCRLVVLIFAIQEFGGEGQHVFAQRDLSYVGGTGGQFLFNRRWKRQCRGLCDGGNSQRDGADCQTMHQNEIRFA